MSAVHKFVPSTSIPDWMAEKVARQAHQRGCGHFNGVKAVGPPRFADSHRASDLVWASVHIADLCNALKITPEQIAELVEDSE